jgi:hypothetical protein
MKTYWLVESHYTDNRRLMAGYEPATPETLKTETARSEPAPKPAIEWSAPISEVRGAVCLQAAEYRRCGMSNSVAMREAWRLVKSGAMSRYVVMPQAETRSQLRLDY